jgi:hypothetical protein
VEVTVLDRDMQLRLLLHGLRYGITTKGSVLFHLQQQQPVAAHGHMIAAACAAIARLTFTSVRGQGRAPVCKAWEYPVARQTAERAVAQRAEMSVEESEMSRSRHVRFWLPRSDGNEPLSSVDLSFPQSDRDTARR